MLFNGVCSMAERVLNRSAKDLADLVFTTTAAEREIVKRKDKLRTLLDTRIR